MFQNCLISFCSTVARTDAFRQTEFYSENSIAESFDTFSTENINNQFFGNHVVHLQSQTLVYPSELLINIKPELIYTLVVELKQTTHDTKDNFPCKVLESNINILSTLLYPFFCSSFSTLKIVIPLFKNGAQNALENCCPIGQLQTITILFERIIFKHLYHSLKYRMSPKLFGSLSNKSPILQLLTYLDHSFFLKANLFSLFSWINPKHLIKFQSVHFFPNYINMILMLNIFHLSILISRTTTKL